METVDEVLREERIDPLALFSEKIRQDVHGLAYVGHIQEPVVFCGHNFVLKTLRPTEKAAAAVASKAWVGTRVEQEMWANAVIALALVSIDGDGDFSPAIGPDINTYARQRLDFVTNAQTGWYQPTLDYLFSVYLGLETRAWQAMQELQDLS